MVGEVDICEASVRGALRVPLVESLTGEALQKVR